MVTRSHTGIFKPKHFSDLAEHGKTRLQQAFFANTEPKGFKSAAKNPQWLMAMEEEMYALRSSNAWDLVPRSVNSSVVESKWIFKTKYHSDGSIERLKALLVSQIFTQVLSLD